MKVKAQQHFIGDRPASYVRLGSRVAGDYGTSVKRFEDSRGITYEVQHDGSVRAVNKPRSRVARLREERADSVRTER